MVVPSGGNGPAIYTGLALATTGTGTFLYAANNLAGTIDVFDSNYAPTTLAGAFEFVRRIDSDQFASPWGVALAPDGFGEFSNALLIGNFNDEFGFINAFDAITGEFLGMLLDIGNDPLTIPYLWGLAFGNGVLSDEGGLYFAAGIGDELHGLFGEIAAVPEPGTVGLLLLGAVGLVAVRRRRS